MAHAMDLPGCDSEGRAVADAITALNARLGLPKGLRDLGVTRELYGRIVDGAMADHCHKTNPRLATREDYVRMLDESM
jgi:alcohol dehydrogenase class IV